MMARSVQAHRDKLLRTWLASMDANLERELFKYEQVYPNSSKTCRTISTVGGAAIRFEGQNKVKELPITKHKPQAAQ